MKRLLTLILLLLLFAVPTLAQSAQTYTLNTGTSINYPDGWNAEVSDNLVILTLGEFSRAIVIDYPVVEMLTNNTETTLTNALLALGRDVLEVNITQSEIENYTVAGRLAERWNTQASGSALSLIAVNFDNGGIGMLITVGVSDLTLDEMVASFDNTNPLSAVNASTPGNIAAMDSSRLIFLNDGARFTLPQGWTGNIQATEITDIFRLAANEGDAQAVLINLLRVVNDNTALEDVLDASGLNNADFGIEYTLGAATPVTIGDHAGLRYALDVTSAGQRISGEIVIVQYSEGGYGFFLAYGADLETFRSDLNILLGSFNNALYGLDYRS